MPSSVRLLCCGIALLATAAAVHNHAHSIIDEPIPLPELFAALPLSVTSWPSSMPNATKVILNFHPWSDLESDCLHTTLASGVLHAGLAPDCTFTKLPGEATFCDLTHEAARALKDAFGEYVAGVYAKCVMGTRKEIAALQLKFGTGQHLNLQFAKMGDVQGVPFVSFAHETTVGSLLALVGEWEASQAANLASLLKPGDVAVDVGAHVGTHTVAMGFAVGAMGVVHAFEAQPAVWEVLQVNAMLAATGNILSHNQAVGLPPGGASGARLHVRTLDFRRPPPNTTAAFIGMDRHSNDDVTANYGGFSVMGCAGEVQYPGEDTWRDLAPAADGDLECQGREGGDVDTVPVPLVTLDSYEMFLSPRTCPKLIKYDVESAETAALLGSNKTISICRPVLHVENNGVATSEQVLNTLFALGYANMFWDVARYAEAANYFGLHIETAEAESKRRQGTRLSINVLAFPPGTDMGALPARLLLALEHMTPVDSNKLLLSMYDTVQTKEFTPARLVEVPIDGGSRFYFGVEARSYKVHLEQLQ